jgi:hypothetical protein
MGRAGRWIIISLVALLALLVLGDRVGNAVAERLAGDTLQSSQHLQRRPDVDIAGFPFLTQLVTGDYGKVTVTAEDVRLGPSARGLTLSRLQVVLHHLSVSRSFSRFQATSASATGTIGFDQLGTALGAQLDYAGNGRVEITRNVAAGGRTVRARATAEPYLPDGALGFRDVSVVGAEGLSRREIERLTRPFRIEIPLQSIPFDVRLRSVVAGSAGVAITLNGRDLVYTR